MFFMMGFVFDAAIDWGVFEDESRGVLPFFGAWFALMALVYQLGPPILMRLTHVRPDESPGDQEQPPAADSGPTTK